MPTRAIGPLPAAAQSPRRLAGNRSSLRNALFFSRSTSTRGQTGFASPRLLPLPQQQSGERPVRSFVTPPRLEQSWQPMIIIVAGIPVTLKGGIFPPATPGGGNANGKLCSQEAGRRKEGTLPGFSPGGPYPGDLLSPGLFCDFFNARPGK